MKKIELIVIIGEIEGHQTAGSQNKATKYENCCQNLHRSNVMGSRRRISPVEYGRRGCRSRTRNCGNDCISDCARPFPLFWRKSFHRSSDRGIHGLFVYRPTGTMVIHPVRMNGMVIGAPQTYDYFSRCRIGSLDY